jgi:hypothetical protein
MESNSCLAGDVGQLECPELARKLLSVRERFLDRVEESKLARPPNYDEHCVECESSHWNEAKGHAAEGTGPASQENKPLPHGLRSGIGSLESNLLTFRCHLIGHWNRQATLELAGDPPDPKKENFSRRSLLTLG